MAHVRLDLNNPEFQRTWFELEAADGARVLAMLRKIAHLNWERLYRDPGLRWEAIIARSAPGGERLYSLRVSQKIRVVAFRDGDFLRLLRVHADRDSAYS